MIYDRIKAFVERLAPELVCDNCVVERLGFQALPADDAEPATAIHELSSSPQFERQIGECALCGGTTPATRKKGH